MRLSVRWKLIFSIVGPLIIISMVVMWLTLEKIYEYSLEQLHEQSIQRVKIYAATLEGQFEKLTQIAKDTAAFIEISGAVDEKTIYELLHSNVANNPLIYGAAIAYEPYQFQPDRKLFSPYVFRGNSGLNAIDIGVESYDYTDNKWEWYARARELDKPIWTEPYFDEGAGNILMETFSVPFHINGKFAGVATIDVPLDKIQQQLADLYLQDQPFVIVSAQGKFITHPFPEKIAHETIQQVAEESPDPAFKELVKNLLAGQTGVTRVNSLESIANEPYWVFYAPISATGWMFSTAVPERKILAFINTQIGRGIIGLSILLLLVIVSVLLVSTHITRPIISLASTVSKLGEGDFSVKMNNIKSQDEIGDLALAFNETVRQLNYHIEAVVKEAASREAVESELRIAREIQTSLLPVQSHPCLESREFDLDAVNVPARHVTGDFFDYFFIDQDQLLLLVADVSGKGAPAAIVMAITRTIIRNLAKSGAMPARLLEETNRVLVDTGIGNVFVTLFIAVYHPATGDIVYSNGGHQPPFVLDPAKDLSMFGEATGTIIGMLEDAEYEQVSSCLEPGQYLIIYTDGIPEARNPDGEFFGTDRFSELLKSCAGMASSEICNHVINEISAFQENKLADDITILVLKRNQ